MKLPCYPMGQILSGGVARNAPALHRQLIVSKQEVPALPVRLRVIQLETPLKAHTKAWIKLCSTLESDGQQRRTVVNFLDQMYPNDGSVMFFPVNSTSKDPLHPAPFVIFKLWQLYCDNVHPLNKTLHAPTFQRKISTYGSHLHLAPAADQALFFAVYLAALSSMSVEEIKTNSRRTVSAKCPDLAGKS